MTLCLKTAPAVLEIKTLEPDGRIEGYGSTFGNPPDTYGDVIQPGAFAESLTEHRRKGTRPKMFWQHDMHSPIGSWRDISEDGKGLWVQGQLNLAVGQARDAYELLKAGDIDGLSIGYYTLDASPDDKRPGVMLLKRLRLVEVSVVSIGANPAATVDTVKSAATLALEAFCRRVRDGDWPPIKDFESVLRDAGLPKSLACEIASHGYAKSVRSESEGTKGKQPPPESLAELRAAIGGFLRS